MQIIKKGTPDSRPQRSDVCTISYEGKLEDGTVVEKFDTIQVNVGDAEVWCISRVGLKDFFIFNIFK